MSQIRKLRIGVNKKSIGTELAAGSRVSIERLGKVVVERTSPPLIKVPKPGNYPYIYHVTILSVI